MLLEKFRKEKRVAFIPYVVAGHPCIDSTEKIVDILVEEGADLLELGVPFSDAMADGPVIQCASEAAAKTMDSVADTLALASRIHAKHPQLPLIIFTYFNPIYRFGLESFALMAKVSGVSSVLVVDLPPEESEDYGRYLSAQGLKTIFLASPTTSAERFKRIEQASTGFVYYVSRTGVTGVQTSVSDTLEAELAKLRSLSDKGIAVGFGISSGEQAKKVARVADAVVVGSAFVKLAAGENSFESIRSLAKEISSAIRS